MAVTDRCPAWRARAGSMRLPVRRVFAALQAGGAEARVVGGAVRNALIGRPVGEIDFGTTATPETVAALAEAAGIKAVPTGVEHGTLTLVVDGRGLRGDDAPRGYRDRRPARRRPLRT